MNDTTRAVEAQNLMQLPAIPATDFFATVLGLPESTFEELIAQGQAPRMFLLGRRRYVLQADALAWLDQIAESNTYVKRKNNKRSSRVQ
jgi:hypothetical protein